MQRIKRTKGDAVHYVAAFAPEGNVTEWTADVSKALALSEADMAKVQAFYTAAVQSGRVSQALLGEWTFEPAAEGTVVAPPAIEPAAEKPEPLSEPKPPLPPIMPDLGFPPVEEAPAEVGDMPASREFWSREDLRREATLRNLDASGTKAELIERLAEDDATRPDLTPVLSETSDGYDAMSKEELLNLINDRSLPVSGNKTELVERLREDDSRQDMGEGS